MNVTEYKEWLLSINEMIYFDGEDFLREKTTNSSVIGEMIREGQRLLEKMDDKEDRYFLCGTLGNLYRICGHPKEAMSYLNNCLNYALTTGNIKKEIVTLIRMGEALKYDSKQREALIVFNKALTRCQENNDLHYSDFVFQHKGKCLVELGLVAEAEECFQEALRIREMKDDLDLIDSTQQALDLVRRIKESQEE